MPPKKSRKNASADVKKKSEMVTRSQSSGMEADMTYYTTLTDGKGSSKSNIQVISKNKLKSDPAHYAELEKKFAKIEKEKLAELDRDKSIDIPNKNFVFFITNFNVFLYAACFFIQVGTMPYLSKNLGADPVIFGQLQTVSAVAQLLGGPLYGRLGDLMGERMPLILAFSSAFLSYFMMGVADNLSLLFLSRLPSVLMHVMQGSQMIVTYLSSESERTSVLSRLGFSYGIGMVVGPALGGFVTKHYGEQFASLMAAGGSLLSVLLVIFFIPYVPKQKKSDDSGSVFDLKKILGLMFAPGVFLLLVIKLICGIPIGIIQSMFSVIAIEQFNMPADQSGMMLSYTGVISLFMQGFGIGSLSARMSDITLMKLSTVTLTLAYLALTQLTGVVDFILLLFPMCCSLCLVNSILTSALTKTVSRFDTGTLLGLNMAVHSVVRSFAPTVGGYLTQNYGSHSLGYVGVLANIICLAIIPFAKLKKDL